MNIWDTLDIAPTSDEEAIRRAYVRQLKQHRPERDPEGYQRVREAWEEAKRYAVLWRDDEAAAADEHDGSMAEESPYLPSDAAAPRITAEYLTDGPGTQAGGAERPFTCDDTAAEDDEDGALLPPEPVYSLDDINRLAAGVLGSEVEGLAQIESSWQRVASTGSLLQQQQFHQHLALALSDSPALTEELMQRLSDRLGWGLEGFDGGGVLPVSVVGQLHDAVRRNAVERAWQALLHRADESYRMKLMVRLIAGNGSRVPFWARLVPDLVSGMQRQIAELRTFYPELIARINPAALRFSQETHVGLSGCGVFLLLFWGLVLNRSADAAQPGGQLETAAGLLLLFYIYAHDVIFLQLLRGRSWILGAWMMMECLLSTLLIAGGMALLHVSAGNSMKNGSVIMTLAELLVVLLIAGAVYRIRARGVPFLRWPGQLIAGLLASPWKIVLAVKSTLFVRAIIVLGLYLFCCVALYELFNAVK